MRIRIDHAKLQSCPGRRGTALALALVVVTVVAMLGAGFLQLTAALTSRQSAAVAMQKAFYLAEAGLAESFQAVRMGRTGQIGSLEAPARYGDGLVYVDVVELDDGTLRLDSNGLYEGGRSSLSLVVEPVELALGFFAEEDLVVDSGLLLDGYSSDEGGYVPTGGGTGTEPRTLSIDPSYPFLHDDPTNRILFYEGTFYRYGTYANDQIDVLYSIDYQQLANDVDYDLYGCDPEDFTDDGWLTDYDSGHEYDGVLEAFARYDQGKKLNMGEETLGEPLASGADDSDQAGATTGVLAGGATSGSGGLLGSNNDVIFSLPPGDVAEVWGDVQPGPSGSVTGLDAVMVSGSTSPRTAPVELPEVKLPVLAQAPPVRHDDLLPMLVPAGSSGYQRIEVAPDAELVIRGPATVLIDSLVLEPGAILTLDTRAGEVSLFVTSELDLQAGSSVVTSGVDPGDMSVQVSSTAHDPLDPAVKLDATAQFHGTVYAPRTDVRIGSEFEIYGGVVAERLEIAPGARLHFDNAGFSGTALPRIIGWRLIEVPAAIRGGGRDPIRALGLDPSTLPGLSEAHDLEAVQLDIEYHDLAGVARSFSGTEDAFDWTNVEQIVSVERDPSRVKEDVGTEEPPAEPEPEPPSLSVRPEVEAAMATLQDGYLKDALISMAPLSTDEVKTMLSSDAMNNGRKKDVLVASSPLEDEPLSILLTMADPMKSVDLSQLLIASSPLSADILAAVQANTAGTLDAQDLDAVLVANQ